MKTILQGLHKPEKHFESVHMDFFNYKGFEFVLFVDTYSRWLEVNVLKKKTTEVVICFLKSIMKTFGDMGTLLTDNGPPFNSHAFEEFFSERGINLIHSPEYQPQSNGLAERFVQTMKQKLRKLLPTVNCKNAIFLFLE